MYLFNNSLFAYGIKISYGYTAKFRERLSDIIFVDILK